ncbi:MAG: radical SAM protein [Proteobacteria bacterium]|nr:radical SAM protein [Pseudomonadota bacterium]
MRVLLISANTEHVNILPLPLGLNCVAVAARNTGHEVKLVDLMTEKDNRSSVREAIVAFHPEIIGISVRNIDDQNMENPRFLLDQVKKVVTDCRNFSSVPIILGGAGYSIFPESALTYLEADMGIQGEGEMSFPLLLDRIERGIDLSGIPGLYVRDLGLQGKRSFVKNLDLLPLADAHISSLSAPDKQEYWMPVQTRRGCPMDCSYCSTATVEGRSIRKRRPEFVIEEITSHVKTGFQRFYFVDNTFNIPLTYAKEMCRKLTESGLVISWRCILYPGGVDKELIHLMARAGCKEVSLGFESGCERILHKMNKRYTLDTVRRTSEMLRDFGIKRLGFLLLGGPGETRESVEQSLVFADSLNLDALKITIGIRIYPHTALARTAIDEGLILPEDNLLLPKFYIIEDLKDWLRETVKLWMADRLHWMS